MNGLIFIIENVLFWIFVYIIVFMGCETPAIVFTGFGFFLFYWIARFFFMKEGWDRVLWFYVINMFVTISLLYYFITGAGVNKGLRNAFNSASRRFPVLEPYLRRF